MNKSNKLRTFLFAIAALVCAVPNAFAQEVVAVGPVERVATNAAETVVLGQVFVRASGEGVNARSLRGVSTGTYVAVRGVRNTSGVLVLKSFGRLDDAYVPGASAVYLSGVVDQFDSARGLVSVGKLQAHTSQALAGSALDIRVGDRIEILGIQVATGTPVWATRIQGIEGTGKTQGIEGTGKTQGIEGTGKKQGIEGTGKTQGIEGTGKKQGIEGTGKTQGIEGTGKTQGIEGTGKTQGIEGTGKTQGIEGTGKTQGIEGTGKTQGIEGTGRSLAGIEGTGRSF